MIGNLDLIIDAVAQKRGEDRRVIEVVAKEMYKRLKTRMVHSEALSLSMPKLGHFVPMNRKLRLYIRELLKKVRKKRAKIEYCKQILANARDEDRIKDFQTQLDNAIMFEGFYLKSLQTALIQLNVIRTMWWEKAQRRKERDRLKSLGLYEPDENTKRLYKNSIKRY